ncbi:hypothetical protein G7046_g6251 [Stylonectria norvegica]|nr:hypothetical protein G7046_g6251 [Stylonectria norvegica]
MTSRVPQPSNRRPSIPQPLDATARDQRILPLASSSNSFSRAKSNTNPHGGSESSSSMHSVDSASRPAPYVLRRKKSSLSSDQTSPRNDSSRTTSSSSLPRSRGSIDRAFGIHLDRGITISPAEIQVAQVVEIQKTTAQSPRIYPELDRYRDVRRPWHSSEGGFDIPYRLATHDLPPPTPVSLLFSGTSGSPSTRFSESPGPNSYSRDTTPTSIASQSPGVISTGRTSQSKARLVSPNVTRPPVTRRRAGSIPNEVDTISVDPHGLAAVRESLTSSSSNSTVRDGDRNTKKANKSSKRLPPPPPSPPPRKSSQKFRQTRDEPTPPTVDRKSSRPLVTSPSSEITTKTTQSPSSPKVTAPSRPSRDGTPDIQSQLFGPMPVIHSNLSSQFLPYERRGSEPNNLSSIPRTSTQLSQADRSASTSRLPVGGEPLSSSRTTTDLDNKKPTKIETPRLIRTPSPNRKKKEKKTLRKGPVAGTGHEGYGRLGAVRRRSGSTTNLARGSPGNQSFEESTGGHDPFLAERINPVIIAGGEIIENHNTSSDLSGSESYQSLTYDLPKVNSEPSSTSNHGSRNTLWPSAMSRTRQPSFGHRRPSDSSDSEGVTMKSTLAFRRSVQRLRSSPENPLRLPQPINTSANSTSPMTSFDTSVMSDDSYSELRREVSRHEDPAHPIPKKLTKRSRSPRKWNLFSRSQAQPEFKHNEKVTATVKAVEKKPVAFYTLMDSSEQEDSDTMDVHEVLRRANVYGDSPSVGSPPGRLSSDHTAPEFPRTGIRTPPCAIKSSRQDAIKAGTQSRPLVTRPVTKTRAIPSVTAPNTSGRPSRLPQVGRIPKVISNRPQQASPKSFSRPFRASLQRSPRGPIVYNADFIAKGPSPPKPSTPVPELTMEGSTIGSGTNVSSSRESIHGTSPELSRVEKEFIAFPPRKNSAGTTDTTSSSCSGSYSFSEATAIIPKPMDPPIEDEIWDEYNDLLLEESHQAPTSATSSKGIPFHLETYESKMSKEKPMESPTIVLDNRKLSIQSKETARSSSYSTDMTERLRIAFQPHPSPSTPFSVSEFVSGYGKRNNSKEFSPKAEKSPEGSRSSHKDRNSSESSASSDDKSPLAQVNLRVGSMTVSKWLTFGHVLFSDVRHDLVPLAGSLKRHSILVIDGLGNDDWSFYAAETYPAATFFNLSPRAPLPPQPQSSLSSFPLSPPNHHQIQYLSHLEKFPFAPQSFTAVVYRFPIAGPETCYRNVLTEARRVLKPGGYIELSILDVDLNNMGNRGRRTVRRLKERVNEKTPDTNLASTSDMIVRLLGKAGFTQIKAARVGVPAASSITPPEGSQETTRDVPGKKKQKDQPSLAEMMNDSSPLADESITKMVSRVGRWWYTRCYESAAESSSDGKSIWSDKALVSECEELGTSLKLMVCCARAPGRITSF